MPEEYTFKHNSMKAFCLWELSKERNISWIMPITRLLQWTSTCDGEVKDMHCTMSILGCGSCYSFQSSLNPAYTIISLSTYYIPVTARRLFFSFAKLASGMFLRLSQPHSMRLVVSAGSSIQENINLLLAHLCWCPCSGNTDKGSLCKHTDLWIHQQLLLTSRSLLQKYYNV